MKKFVVRAEINAPTNAASNSSYMISALKILGNKTGLPIPKVLWAEHDATILGGPFCVMEFFEGIIAPDSPPFTTVGWVYDATEEQRRKMYQSGIGFLADLHKTDWEGLGLDFLVCKSKGGSQTEWHVDKAVEIYDGAIDQQRGEIEQATIQWLKANIPVKENLCLSWGDSRPGNMLWRDFELIGALDWEMCTLLDPAYDVALWLLADYGFAEGAGIMRLPGMLEREDFITAYENAAGVTLENFDYFELLAAFRSHAVVGNMVSIWEKNGQHFFGEGITIENNPIANAFKKIASNCI